MVDEEIAEAKRYYGKHGAALAADETLTRLLGTYQAAIGKTDAFMREAGIHRTCGRCASGPGGSCCFEGVEAWYDRYLLLINLLLGVEIPHVGAFPGHCRFVGGGGCGLIARYAFCVNYLCPMLKEILGPEGCCALSSIVGEELASGIKVEHHLFKRIARTEGAVTASRA
jgi:hypothetical protein